MNIWEYGDYKSFIRDWIKERPKSGRGELKKMATHLGVHTTLLSHVVNGEKDFSHEQLFELSSYMGLDKSHREYLYTLFCKERSASHSLRSYYSDKLKELQKKALSVSGHIKVEKAVSDKHKQRFYSSWFYSAIRLLTAIPKYQTVEQLMKKTSLDRSVVKSCLDFLVEAGLCDVKKGIYSYGPLSTHVNESDPLVLSHHRNWRLQMLMRLESRHLSADELHFTMPVVLTEKESVQVKKQLLNTIREITTLTDPADCEELYILNMDWVKF